MSIPVSQGMTQSVRQLIAVFKTASLESQRAQLFLLRFNQIELASILGQEQDLNLRPSGQGQHRSCLV
jgi:hypothetical protein